MCRLLPLILIFLLLPTLSWGTACGTGPFYVSSGIGSDSNNGTSPVTPWAHHPWDLNKTGNASCTLVAGNIVYMRRGDAWYNTCLSSGESGSAGSTILTTSTSSFYAVSSSDPLPKLSGAYAPSGSGSLTWGRDGSYNDWYATVSSQVYTVLWNGVELTPVTTQGLCQSTTNSFNSTSGTVYVNVGGASPSTGICEVGKQDYVVLTGGNYQTFSYLDFRAGNTSVGGTAFNNGSQSIIFDHDTIEGYVKYGIYQYGGSTAINSGNQVTNCTITQEVATTAVAGIYANDCSAPTITGNTITPASVNTAAAILISNSPNATILGNVTTGTTATATYRNGLSIQSGSNGFTIGSILSPNTFAYLNHNGIMVTNSGSGTISNNTIHDVVSSVTGNGIWLYNSSGSTVQSNLIYNCASGSYNTGHGTGIYLSGSSGGNILEQNGLFYNYINIELAASTQTAGNLTIKNVAAHATVNGIDIEATSSSAGVYEQVYNNTVLHNPSGSNYAPSCTGPGTPGAGCTGYQTGYVGHGIDCQFSCNRAKFANNLVYLLQPGASSNCQAFAIAGPFASIYTDYNLLYDGTAGSNGYIGQLNGAYYTAVQQQQWQSALQGTSGLAGMDGAQAHAESHEYITNPLFTNGSGSYSLASDFTLLPGSPAINAGTSVGLSTDYAGNPIKGLPDIGAYEHQGTSLSLSPGWNLISLPMQPTDTAVSMVLSGIAGLYHIVWAYPDQSWRLYGPTNPGGSALTTMEAGKGYWIHMTAAGTLYVSGSVPPTSISLLTGWNLVGYNAASCAAPSTALSELAGTLEIVWAYVDQSWTVYDPDDAPGSTLTQLCPNYGYWTKVKQATTWSGW